MARRGLSMSSRTSILVALLLTLAGCASSGRVRQISPGVYSASTTGDGYVSAPRLREESLDRAEAFCQRQGKRMVVPANNSKEVPAGNDTTVIVTFKCIEG
jgi:hypothetical protein